MKTAEEQIAEAEADAKAFVEEYTPKSSIHPDHLKCIHMVSVLKVKLAATHAAYKLKYGVE